MSFLFKGKTDEIEKYKSASTQLLEEKNRLLFQVDCLKASKEDLQRSARNFTDKQRSYKQNVKQDLLIETQKHENKCKALLDKYNREMKLKEDILLKESVNKYNFCFESHVNI